MLKPRYHIPLKPGQWLYLTWLGDVHWDTPECDQDRVMRFVEWARSKEKSGHLVRIIGPGDYLDLASPTERRQLGTETLHEGTYVRLDRSHLGTLKEFLAVLWPIRSCFLGLLSGHHYYRFITKTGAGQWQGKNSDEWLASRLGCDYLGTGSALIRLTFPNHKHLDILTLHGSGSAQTPGGRVQKRIRFSEIAPTAHIVASGHDNAKLAYPRSGIDYDEGRIKRYVIGTGSFQKAYLEGETEAGYAERWGLVPADLGITLVTIQLEQRHGKYRLDYHASV